jgi:predicted metal-dependent HD superfamily phosphohydrolase
MHTSTYVFEQFQDAIRLLNPDYSADSLVGCWGDIVSHYTYGEGNSNRAYHNLGHVRFMLENYYNIVNPHPYSENIMWPTMVLAIIYHDVIYNIGSKTNEEDSATFACEDINHLLMGTDPVTRDARLDIIRQLIMATKHPITEEMAKTMSVYELDIHDLDLLGLADECLVVVNNEKVKREYMYHFTPEQIKDGQRKFFGKMLEGRIYLSPNFFGFERYAKALIQKHIID